jgi:hypothetical protein
MPRPSAPDRWLNAMPLQQDSMPLRINPALLPACRLGRDPGSRQRMDRLSHPAMGRTSREPVIRSADSCPSRSERP